MTNKKRSGIFIIIFIAICLVLLYSAWNALAPKYNYQPPQTKIATPLKPVKPISSFKLYDSTGNVFSEKSLRGHWTLLFFGYPGCPDICPRTLGLLRDTWDLFEAQSKSAPVRFIFADISKQPVSINELQQFLHNYRPEFMGITGTSTEIHALSDQLGIYTREQNNALDHTSALMLIDTQGRLFAVLTPPFTAEEIMQDLQTLTSS